MKGYGFQPAYPAATPVTALPRREVWRPYKRDRERLHLGAVVCGRCEASTSLPSTEGWQYRKFSVPLFTEVRCRRCQRATGVEPGTVTAAASSLTDADVQRGLEALRANEFWCPRCGQKIGSPSHTCPTTSKE